jgi:Tfp pilus assembly protein PilF
MNPTRWELVDRALQYALAASEADRDARLAEVCGDDESLRAEVLSLVEAGRERGVLDVEMSELAADVFGMTEECAVQGRAVGGYRVIRHIGSGGMSDVYLALDRRLGRSVALKVLAGAWTTDAGRIGRFHREAQVASALNHPNIVTVYDVGQANGSPFIATEFVEGETLRSRLTRPILPAEAIRIAVQIASALVATHRARIVHRDIKPENVMLRPDGVVKILDFGVAKLRPGSALESVRAETIPGMVFGTTPYMSPEQAQGLSVDGRTDLFSVGVVLFEMVSGRPPFTGATGAATVASILRDQPPRIVGTAGHIPLELVRIIDRALSKNPDERYQRAEDLLADLTGLLEHGGSKPGFVNALWRVPLRSAAVGAVAIAATLLTAGAVSNYRWTRASGETTVAASEDARARQLFLKGRYFWNKRTVPSLTTAIAYFEEASKVDPKYPLAFVGLADAYVALGGNPGSPRPAREYFSKAKVAAVKAVELDPRTAQAYVSLATVRHFLDWDWPGAERDFKKALVLNPQIAEAHQRYGIYLAFMHRFDEATAALKRAEELDPVSLAIATDSGVVQNFARRPDLAIPQLCKALEIDPTYARARLELALAYTQQGMYEAAADELHERNVAPTAPIIRVARDRQWALAGRPTNTQQLLTDLLDESQRRYVPPTAIAELHAALDQRDEAFRWLDVAFEERSPLLLRAFVDPRWERYSIHKDPRFAQLRQRVGL